MMTIYDDFDGLDDYDDDDDDDDAAAAAAAVGVHDTRLCLLIRQIQLQNSLVCQAPLITE